MRVTGATCQKFTITISSFDSMSSPLKNASTVSYTPAETKLINLAFKHMKSVPDVSSRLIQR